MQQIITYKTTEDKIIILVIKQKQIQGGINIFKLHIRFYINVPVELLLKLFLWLLLILLFYLMPSPHLMNVDEGIFSRI